MSAKCYVANAENKVDHLWTKAIKKAYHLTTEFRIFPIGSRSRSTGSEPTDRWLSIAGHPLSESGILHL